MMLTQLRPATGPGATRTEFLVDRNASLPQLALERDGSGATLRRYTYGLGLTPLSLSTPSTTSYLSTDGLGSVLARSSATGALERSATYEPFGSVLAASRPDPAAPGDPLGFTGAYTDPTGLLHLRARQYDPSIGRFLSVDPVAASIGDPYVGAYVYVGDNPVRYVDPSGRCFGPLIFLAPACTGAAIDIGTATVAAAALGVAWLVTEVQGDTVQAPQTSLFKGATRRELEKEIKDAGWKPKPGSGRGPHDVFEKPGQPDIKLPRHKDISPDVTRQIRDILQGGRNAFAILPTDLGSNVK